MKLRCGGIVFSMLALVLVACGSDGTMDQPDGGMPDGPPADLAPTSCPIEESTIFSRRFHANYDGRQMTIDDVTNAASPARVLTPDSCGAGSSNFACGVLDDINPALTATATTSDVPGGVDLVVNIVNPTSMEQTIAGNPALGGGGINVTGIDVGRTLINENFSRGHEELTRIMDSRAGVGCSEGWRCAANNVCVSNQPCACDSQCGPTLRCTDADGDGKKECGLLTAATCTNTETANWAMGSSSWNAGAGQFYPGDIFSPVAVIRNVRGAGGARYSMGVSVIYPILEYKHPIAIHLIRAAESSKVTIWIRTTHLGGAECQPTCNLQVKIPANTTRTYRIAIRFVPEGEPWIATLLPYRNEFSRLYGSVTYTRDPRPMHGEVVAQSTSGTNPRGYTSDRPDLNGWGARVAGIRASRDTKGFSRHMMWAAAGVYTDSFVNYPFLMLSPLDPRAPDADVGMASTTLQLLRDLAKDPAPFTMGYYHGYASVYHSRWNPLPDRGTCAMHPATSCRNNNDCPGPGVEYCQNYVRMGQVEPLSPYSTDTTLATKHRNAVFREYDMAVGLGTKEIGQDAVGLMPLWDLYPWIRELRAKYPGVRFTGESNMSDLYVLHGGNFLFGNTNPRGPHILADFLIPGHESWAPLCLSETDSCQAPIANQADPRFRRDALDTAARGYVPFPLNFDVDISDGPARYEAARTWMTTIPMQLREPCRPDLY